MLDPHWWLKYIRRGEKVVGLSLLVTIAWLLLWAWLCPHDAGKGMALTHTVLVGSIWMAIEVVAWAVKFYLFEVIDDQKSVEDWKEIQEGRWPSG